MTLDSGLGSRRPRRHFADTTTSTPVCRQHANRLPQAAAQAIANDSPAKALSGHEAVAVVFQPVDETSQD
jgi:hypothetical protein